MKTALFIDDNPQFLELIGDTVKELPVVCDYTDKLSTAYELMLKKTYDYIFLDYKMGSVDADGLLMGIDKIHTKIFIFTHLNINFVKERLKDFTSKIDGYIDKINFEEELIRALNGESN